MKEAWHGTKHRYLPKIENANLPIAAFHPNQIFTR